MKVEHVGLVHEYTGVGERGSVDSLLQEEGLVSGWGGWAVVYLPQEREIKDVIGQF